MTARANPSTTTAAVLHESTQRWLADVGRWPDLCQGAVRRCHDTDESRPLIQRSVKDDVHVSLSPSSPVRGRRILRRILGYTAGQGTTSDQARHACDPL